MSRKPLHWTREHEHAWRHGLASRIRNVRLRLKRTQAQLARELMVATKTVTRAERAHGHPSSVLLFRLCLMFGVNPNYLYSGDTPIFHRWMQSVFDLIEAGAFDRGAAPSRVWRSAQLELDKVLAKVTDLHARCVLSPGPRKVWDALVAHLEASLMTVPAQRKTGKRMGVVGRVRAARRASAQGHGGGSARGPRKQG